MRIIGGRFKGRKFHPPAKNWPTRPTTDFAKEALFNILQNNFYFEDIKALDLFGGTGSHSYEFISRGCTDVTYVDKFGACVAFVKNTAKTLKIQDHLHIIRGDVFKFIARSNEEYDYIFIDPPHALPTLPTLPDLIFEKKMLKKDGWLVLEHNANNSFSNHPNLIQERKYGDIIFSFFSHNTADEA